MAPGRVDRKTRGPGARAVGGDICEQLGRQAPRPPVESIEALRELYGRLDVAEAVFDLCTAHAWHAVAPPTSESLMPVGPAYERLRGLLELNDQVLHELLERFDLDRAFLLASVVSICLRGIDTPVSTSPRHKITRAPGAVFIECEHRESMRAQFVEALLDMTNGTRTTDCSDAGIDPTWCARRMGC